MYCDYRDIKSNNNENPARTPDFLFYKSTGAVKNL